MHATEDQSTEPRGGGEPGAQAELVREMVQDLAEQVAALSAALGRTQAEVTMLREAQAEFGRITVQAAAVHRPPRAGQRHGLRVLRGGAHQGLVSVAGGR